MHAPCVLLVLEGRVAVGSGTGSWPMTLSHPVGNGGYGGTEDWTLSVGQMPIHKHAVWSEKRNASAANHRPERTAGMDALASAEAYTASLRLLLLGCCCCCCFCCSRDTGHTHVVDEYPHLYER